MLGKAARPKPNCRIGNVRVQLLVQVVLELPEAFRDQTSRLSLVDEIMRPVEHGADADQPPLDHRVEIASERRFQLVARLPGSAVYGDISGGRGSSAPLDVGSIVRCVGADAADEGGALGLAEPASAAGVRFSRAADGSGQRHDSRRTENFGDHGHIHERKSI